MKKALIISALGAIFMASCADEFDQTYEVGRPDMTAEYAYLNDYQPLKEYLSRPDFKLGLAVDAADYSKQTLVYSLTNSNFNEVVAGNAMKMASCVDDNGVTNFTTVIDFVNAATDAGVPVYGHTLAWHSQQPAKWLNSLIANREIEVNPDEQVVVEDSYFSFADYTSYPFFDGLSLGERAFEDGCLVIKPQEPTGANWERQYFIADWFSLKAGTEYTVTVRIKGTSDGHADVVFGTWGAANNGFIDFTDEWQELSTTITAAGDANSDAHVMFQTGLYTGEIRIEWVKVTHGETPVMEFYVDQVENGAMEVGKSMDNFIVREFGKEDVPGTILEGQGPDGKNCIKITSVKDAANTHDTQFFITNPNKTWEKGEKYRISFWYRATEEAASETQCHIKPGGYIHWQMLPQNPTFTTEWQYYEKIATIPEQGDGMQTIAFNLNVNKNVVTYYFADIQWQTVEKGNTIPLSPEEKKDTLTWAMDQWIAGMMEACDGKVKAWDVVNEAIAGDGDDGEGFYPLQSAVNGGNSDFFWQDYLGSEDYVRTAVRLARQYGPEDIKLFVNDYNLESDWDDNKKLKSLIHWIKKWEADGVTKIDGIGTQMHISCYANPQTQASKKAAIENMFKLMKESGKLVRVSELDMGYVDAENKAVKTADMTEEQHHEMAELYKFVIQKYLEIIPESQQWGITQWCATDAPDTDNTWRRGEPVGLWDSNYYRKHTYAGFADGLAGK